MVENLARWEVKLADQRRGIERLAVEGCTEEDMAISLALPIRLIEKLRLVICHMCG